VINFNGIPYHFDENLGYMVQTEVTIESETIPMHLFVMDGANKAQRAEDYTYKGRYGEKVCQSATMFDINTTIMRCLVKNIAMFGLGLYIYAGEDIPQAESDAANELINTYLSTLIELIDAADVALITTWDEMDRNSQSAVWKMLTTAQKATAKELLDSVRTGEIK